MQEKEILAKILLLKHIKPREEWALLTKNRILGSGDLQENKFPFILTMGRVVSFFRAFQKPALAVSVVAMSVMIGMLIQVSARSLPGDPLYSLKAAFERTQVSLSPGERQVFGNLELAQRRLEDLKKIAEHNKVGSLPPAIKEFETTVRKASKQLNQLVRKEPHMALEASKEVVKIEKGQLEIERILGTKIGGQEKNELQNFTKLLLENEIADLETRSLTPEQKLLFQEAKLAYEQGNYQTALEKIWMLSQK